MTPPQNLTKVRSQFLVYNYYRKAVIGLSEIVKKIHIKPD